jgi:hypothetical protein
LFVHPARRRCRWRYLRRLEMVVGDYRFVRRYLERNPQLPLSLRPVKP